MATKRSIGYRCRTRALESSAQKAVSTGPRTACRIGCDGSEPAATSGASVARRHATYPGLPSRRRGDIVPWPNSPIEQRTRRPINPRTRIRIRGNSPFRNGLSGKPASTSIGRSLFRSDPTPNNSFRFVPPLKTESGPVSSAHAFLDPAVLNRPSQIHGSDFSLITSVGMQAWVDTTTHSRVPSLICRRISSPRFLHVAWRRDTRQNSGVLARRTRCGAVERLRYRRTRLPAELR
jgi:hypothetical protein